MEEVSLNETETRYYSDLFLCCDVEKTGKIPMLKATELYRSANISNDVIIEITSLAGIPETALHISRAQFYSCLKLIAAHQAGITLREELLSTDTVQLPLPRFSWKESPADDSVTGVLNSMPIIADTTHQSINGIALNTSEHRHSITSVGSRRNSAIASALQLQQQQPSQCCEVTPVNSDILSTDSEIEQNESSGGGGAESASHLSVNAGLNREKNRRRSGSPEAWSTNSDSPTPTNSVAERPWAKETLWQGLLGDEHRQLLGTEEESSDRHSSDDDENEHDVNVMDLEAVYQINKEQREYYYKQFMSVQHDPNGLLSGLVARVFFEKSRIPIEELRHIWQLCDVTRDGALSLSEFIAAMHLVVLRRNNIPLPAVLPSCLHPNVIQQAVASSHEPAEADLLHLNDDDDEDNTDNTVIGAAATVKYSSKRSGGVANNGSKNVMNLSVLSSSSQTSLGAGSGTPPSVSLATSNKQSPNADVSAASPNANKATVNVNNNQKPKDCTLWNNDVPLSQWTKFTESPTSNVSSPGPKPVNFDMQRTAQAVVSDPQILHPVPLRVTPVGATLGNATVSGSNADSLNQEAVTVYEPLPTLRDNNNSPKQFSNIMSVSLTAATSATNRDVLQGSDLRAIQRPQAKKLPPPKNAGALPPPPQREPSLTSANTTLGSFDTNETLNTSTNNINNNTNNTNNNKVKDVPPLPPPRPSHRHGRSSSLDLNKFKMNATGFQHSEQHTNNVQNDNDEIEQEQQMHSLIEPPVSTQAFPPTRLTLQQVNQRKSAFEVYRKPNSHSPPISLTHSKAHQQVPQQPLQPPPPAPFGAAGAAAIAAPPQLPNADNYEKRVNSISETLRHVSFKPDQSITDILRNLREQNNLLLRLCNDLSDELLTVQTQKEEMRLKLENLTANETILKANNVNNTGTDTVQVVRTGSSISAPVSANLTGGSNNSASVNVNTSFI